MSYDIERFVVKSGRLIDENGEVQNIVDLLQGDEPVGDKNYDVERFPAQSSRVIGEDGRVYNLVDLLSGGIGGGGGAPAEHNHDERYYRKEEIDGSINSLADSLYTVKAKPDDQPDYLVNKVDNVTLTFEGSELKVKSVDGLTVGVAEISSWLSGTTGNIQSQIDGINDSLTSITAGMRYLGKQETYADLLSITKMKNGDLAVVLTDENRTGGRSMYVYSEDLASWEFIGEFTFTDEFLALKDTPSSYTGADGKVVKVAGGRLVFGNVDYGELPNKPSSTVTQIDDAVSKRHEHNNAKDLAKLGVNENGELTINGVVYTAKDKPKQRLYARRTGSEQSLTTGTDCVFNTKYGGEGIPYNTSTGVFTLEAGKNYRIFVTASINTEGYVIMRLVSASGNAVTADNNQAIWMSVNPSNSNWKEASAGPLLAYITPTSTQGFKIRATSVSGTSGLRPGHCALEITEI